MPYIPPNRRNDLPYEFFGQLRQSKSEPTPGDVNYLIMQIADEYLNIWGLKYEHLNALIGAIECAKLELTRRVVGPYEDEAIDRNGDVFSSTNLPHPSSDEQ